MKYNQTLIAAALVASAVGANAEVVGSIGGGTGPFLTLTSTGLAPAGTFAGASLTGGTVYSSDQPVADMPKGAGQATVGSFLAAGPSSGEPATLTFATGVSSIGFLWGSPDLYNLLTVTSSTGVQTFVANASAGNPGATSLGFVQANGNQDFSQYVTFTGVGSTTILALGFSNSPASNAFESSNFSVSAVPEPETYALMLAGLGVIAFIGRRRRRI